MGWAISSAINSCTKEKSSTPPKQKEQTQYTAMDVKPDNVIEDKQAPVVANSQEKKSWRWAGPGDLPRHQGAIKVWAKAYTMSSRLRFQRWYQISILTAREQH